MTDGHPPDPAYGRVTNAERFRTLWPATDELVKRLRDRYDVDRDDPLDSPPDFVGTARRVLRHTRLAPEVGAPLAIAYTDFPGLIVRFGRWHVRAFPHCGCDACDEQVDALAEELDRLVTDLVAGRFTESLTRSDDPRLSWAFASESGWSWISPEDADRLGDPASLHWPAWQAKGSED